MKRYIKSNASVFAMAFPRNVALRHLSDNSEAIRDHLIKCCVYHSIRPNDMHKWIFNELSTWLADASDVKVKHRWKPVDIESTVFGELGTDVIDARTTLRAFQRKFCDPKSDDPYPLFEITDELVIKLYNMYTAVKSACIPKLIAKTNYPKVMWGSWIEPVIQHHLADDVHFIY